MPLAMEQDPPGSLHGNLALMEQAGSEAQAGPDREPVGCHTLCFSSSAVTSLLESAETRSAAASSCHQGVTMPGPPCPRGL